MLLLRLRNRSVVLVTGDQREKWFCFTCQVRLSYDSVNCPIGRMTERSTMSGWRASPSLEVFTDRVHELNILAQAAADLDQLLTAAAGLKARAWCVSQAGFTPAALTFAAENDILISNAEDLAALAKLVK